MTKNNTSIKYPFILNLSKYYIHNNNDIIFTNPSNTNPSNTNPSSSCIDLEHYTENRNTSVNLTYKLSSVICHKGMLNYGHYYAFICKNDTATHNDTWYLCNDDTVQQVDNDTISNIIINSNAYILSYELIQ
jgi:ubiquitin C-terminal hydrolase